VNESNKSMNAGDRDILQVFETLRIDTQHRRGKVLSQGKVLRVAKGQRPIIQTRLSCSSALILD